MTPDQVQALINKSLLQLGGNQRFQLTSPQRHTHNGTDSARAFQPTFTYTGYVRSDYTIITTASPQTASGIFPAAWSLTKVGTGTCKITHNLNTKAYSIVAMGNQTIASLSGITNNSVNITTYQVGAGGIGLADASFYFLLTQVSNISQTPPAYIYIH